MLCVRSYSHTPKVFKKRKRRLFYFVISHRIAWCRGPLVGQWCYEESQENFGTKQEFSLLSFVPLLNSRYDLEGYKLLCRSFFLETVDTGATNFALICRLTDLRDCFCLALYAHVCPTFVQQRWLVSFVFEYTRPTKISKTLPCGHSRSDALCTRSK